ncbi:hypothetical protein M0R72_05870 [Candidatus Pacearchaeota archaeon]|jgi:hypothetical protein|nr:hypothetical protein [Candidatus Pacearchaeota archaeon]
MNGEDIILIGAGIFTCALIAAMFTQNAYLLIGSDAEYTITVNEKWIKGNGDEGQKYLMSDMEGNVYSVEDSWWKWAFDASNRFAIIKPGHTYHISTFGRRSPFFSNYPNAIEIQEVFT